MFNPDGALPQGWCDERPAYQGGGSGAVGNRNSRDL